jgi:DNA (cytosine-5)-methyltransferase 1
MTTQEPKLITIREAAEMLGVHQETLRRWDNDGKLKAVRVGKVGHRKYKIEEIEQLLRTS